MNYPVGVIPLNVVATDVGATTCTAAFLQLVATAKAETLKAAGYAKQSVPLLVPVPVCTTSATAAHPPVSTDAINVHLSNKFVNSISVIAFSLINVAVLELDDIMKLQFLNTLDLGSATSVLNKTIGLAQEVAITSDPIVQSKKVQLSPANNSSCAVVPPRFVATSNTNEQFL